MSKFARACSRNPQQLQTWWKKDNKFIQCLCVKVWLLVLSERSGGVHKGGQTAGDHSVCRSNWCNSCVHVKNTSDEWCAEWSFIAEVRLVVYCQVRVHQWGETNDSLIKSLSLHAGDEIDELVNRCSWGETDDSLLKSVSIQAVGEIDESVNKCSWGDTDDSLLKPISIQAGGEIDESVNKCPGSDTADHVSQEANKYSWSRWDWWLSQKVFLRWDWSEI